MRAADRSWRATVLTYSRAAGVLLATGVLVVAGVLAGRALSAMNSEHERGRAHAQAFIAKVRACRRTPAHPSWNDCERRVQDAE